MTIQHGKYPNSFYRVSVKAVIKSDAGEVLAVKEHSDEWELPGGGLEHGEMVHDGLRRELSEELGISNNFAETFVKAETHYLELIEGWKVMIEGDFSPTAKNVREVKFIPIETYNRNRRKSVEPEI